MSDKGVNPFHIVLVEPQIPQNTGNIGRLCVASGSVLHLIHPLGFSTSQKELKRAGLDYWQSLSVYEWQNLAAFWESHPFDAQQHFFFSTKAKRLYYDAPLAQAGYLYFGREDAGLNAEILKNFADNVYKMPMTPHTRSINLATCVGAVLYEGVRQSKLYENWDL
ncbi:tRNA (cytidine(34)-2'-O)-methyltransferase [Helicobacter sp. MIT 05-5293]|uniref:tRNA (cytidine(34)-2'-O)-methyltransferase n=1 Tax=Helicobacter sp. MIT 05-5293 TaxID=1548149 RepID=UPI00051D9063|nr:tRNA (cytidine(34)-2'-O)-methyltransferase [Helicobacter sp. MIT 05-5293]TLD80416.1 tRNA (cytidine(34)-2'-O)-methyltransferase [Helicobacter sp. MIT 05-5293]